jgi:hypothetical protein
MNREIVIPEKCLKGGYLAHMITFRCNGGCPYCLVQGRGKTHHYDELPGSDVIKIWNSVRGHDGLRLSIIGGECTLHKDFVEIIHGLCGYQVTITTNLATAFFDRPDFWRDLVVPYKLRVNTTFHPSSPITAERYAERIGVMKANGIWVDQIGMVQHPELDKEKWKKKFAELGLPMRQITFLGFWDEASGFCKDMREETLFPNERSDKVKIMSECGIDDIARYKAQCGQPQDSVVEWDCAHGTLCFIVAPDGTVHECHYKLYYNIDPLGNALTGFTPITGAHTCSSFGKCNFCDIPRLRQTGLDWKTMRKVK